MSTKQSTNAQTNLIRFILAITLQQSLIYLGFVTIALSLSYLIFLKVITVDPSAFELIASDQISQTPALQKTFESHRVG